MPDYKQPVKVEEYIQLDGHDLNLLRTQHPNTIAGVSDFSAMQRDIFEGLEPKLGAQDQQ